MLLVKNVKFIIGKDVKKGVNVKFMRKSKNQLNIFEQEEIQKQIDKFTEEQKNFIFYEGKSSVIFSATAGSGKTFSCVQRLKELLRRGVDPKKIIFFSFTNAAVEELKERVNNKDIRITTIHSFCFWMLHRMKKFKKITNFYEFLDWYKEKNRPSNSAKEQERIIFEKKMSNLYDDAEYYDSQISSYKLQTAEGIKVRKPEFLIEYSIFLKETKKRDFSDILIEVRNLLKEDKWLKLFKDNFDYLFVDEYQDTSAIQMEILLRLNAKHYYLVGDQNQSIYNYSGSNCKLIEEMLEKRRKVERMTLTTNFRSGKIIVENSNKFSSLPAKSFNDFQGEIYDKLINFEELIDLMNKNEEVVVLARTNFAVKLIELNLLKRKVPIRYFNYLKDDEIEKIKKSEENIITKRKINYVLEDFHNDKNVLINFLEQNKNSKSFVTTIHKSKGKEFDTCVVVNSLSEEIIEKNNVNIPEDKKEKYMPLPGSESYYEEKNVHYVAVSRAKNKMYYMLLQIDK
jgi:superfamily I DNA/RNA helicase